MTKQTKVRAAKAAHRAKRVSKTGHNKIGSAFKKSNASTKVGRESNVAKGGKTHMRSKATIRRLNMYNDSRWQQKQGT